VGVLVGKLDNVRAKYPTEDEWKEIGEEAFFKKHAVYGFYNSTFVGGDFYWCYTSEKPTKDSSGMWTHMSKDDY
jgi:hypothetical protein